MRIVVIGGVAAGTSAAAKARRNMPDAEIAIYEKDRYISYAGCGIPYYIGDVVKNIESIAPRDPAYFKKVYDVDVHTEHEVISIDPETNTLVVKNLITGNTFEDRYDRLVLAMGARAVVPPIKGADRDNVFVLRNIQDMFKVKKYIDKNNPRKAVIIGTGFIGQEVSENFKLLGMEITMVEKLDQVTPGLDPDMAIHVEEHLKQKGVSVITGASVEEIGDNAVKLADGTNLDAEIVILATGVRPNVEIAKEAGIELGDTGAIRVNDRLETNLKGIYACGDCAEQIHIITGKPVFRPLGTTANKMGRIAGDNVSGGDLPYRGVLGTGIFRVFDMTVAFTGLSEREAKNEGYSVVTSMDRKLSKTSYMDGKEIIIKGVADAKTGRLLGAQIVGEDGVDKRIDVFVTAITFGAKAEDLFHLDLAYSPPYSTARDPVMYTGMILESAIRKFERENK
ncbi:MAG: FAD-dependent oxidoreductase [Anaerovoracaceae bacterium]|jgi:NADPH-dependent 2,4-dienoyl-CoA reductase/sulfur reductase-like enzyme|nr:dehydrogenase [Clostridiales bacterium UBA9856]